MAKAIKQEPTIKSVSYGITRVSTYEWQANKVTVYSDSTVKDEPIFKPDVYDIVLRRVSEQIKLAGQETFSAAAAKAKTDAR